MAPGTLCTRNQQRWGLGPVGVGHPGHWEPLAVGTPGVGHWEPLALGPMGTGTHGHQALRPTDWHWETQVPTGAGTHKHGALGTVMVGSKTHWCWVPPWASGTRTYWCWDPWALGTGSRWCRTPPGIGHPGHWDPFPLGTPGTGNRGSMRTGTGWCWASPGPTSTEHPGHWDHRLWASTHQDALASGTGSHWCCARGPTGDGNWDLLVPQALSTTTHQRWAPGPTGFGHPMHGRQAPMGTGSHWCWHPWLSSSGTPLQASGATKGTGVGGTWHPRGRGPPRYLRMFSMQLRWRKRALTTGVPSGTSGALQRKATIERTLWKPWNSGSASVQKVTRWHSSVRMARSRMMGLASSESYRHQRAGRVSHPTLGMYCRPVPPPAQGHPVTPPRTSHVLWMTMVLVPPIMISDVYSSSARLLSPT